MHADAVMLRPARAADAHALAVMSRDLIEAGLPWRYVPERLARTIASPDTSAVVACHGNAPQGFAVMQFGHEHAHLVLLCVQPRHQRSGIGRRLIEWLLASAQVAGVACVHLELRADNHAAHAFYRALGFSDTLLLPGYYDGLIAARRMLRQLRDPDAPLPAMPALS